VPATAPQRRVLFTNGDKLRAWRDATGKNRELVCAELRDRYGEAAIGFSWLAALEGGSNRSEPSLQTLIMLAEYYGHDPAELLTQDLR
jgi:transcriptional regulator with XRE-family HTH domain